MEQVFESKELKIDTLKKRSDFLRIAGLRQKWISPAIVVQFAPKPDDVECGIRVGYTASKKVGNAVARSRAKRRLRALVKEIMQGHGHVNYDYVLIARQEILDRPYAELIRDLKWSLKRLHNNKNNKRGA